MGIYIQPNSTSSKGILYVDDDQDDKDLFLEVVKEVRPNLHCHLASDGTEALDLLRKIALPACIYLDLNMPIMNGLQTLRALKADQTLAMIPTFILTTANSPIIESEVRALGAVDYLIKPSTYQEFVRLLDTCFTAHIG